MIVYRLKHVTESWWIDAVYEKDICRSIVFSDAVPEKIVNAGAFMRFFQKYQCYVEKNEVPENFQLYRLTEEEIENLIYYENEK